MTLPIPGLRQKVYLAGHEFSRPPVAFGRLKPTIYEANRRTASGSARRDVLIPFTGACVRPAKYTFSCGWDVFEEADAEAFEAAIADDEPCDFTPWLSRAETFRFLEGESYAGTLQRRDALTQCPIVPSVTTGLAPRLKIDGVTATITLGTPDAYYRTPWTASGTAPVGGSVAVVWYIPLFRVYLTESDEQPDTLQRVVAACILDEV